MDTLMIGAEGDGVPPKPLLLSELMTPTCVTAGRGLFSGDLAQRVRSHHRIFKVVRIWAEGLSSRPGPAPTPEGTDQCSPDEPNSSPSLSARPTFTSTRHCTERCWRCCGVKGAAVPPRSAASRALAPRR